MRSSLEFTAVLQLVLLIFVFAEVSATDDHWSGTIQGKGTDIGQLLFDQWSFSYAAINTKTNISFFGATGGNAISQAAVTSVTDGFLDFAQAEQPLQTFQKNYAKQDIIQFPVAAVPLVFVYNLPYGSGTMMDVTNQTTQLILDGPIAQQIWIKNLTNWRDPRLLALQTPQVQALLPDANITLVIRSESCSATNFIQGSLRNFSTSTWPFGSASQTWSSAFKADARVLPVRENSGVAALVAYTPNSIGYVTFAASVKNARYAAMININGDLVRSPDLTPALEHPYAIQTFHSSTGYVSNALLNSRAAKAWPMGGYSFAIFRSRNTSMPCARRREMLLFFNWILGSDFEQRRMGVYGFQSLGRTILNNVLDDLRKTPRCFFNATESPIAWSTSPQHLPESSFQAVLGAAMAMLIITVILFVLYMTDKFHKIATSARVFKVVLFTGGVLNYVALIYFYKVPDSDSVCQARLWLSALGFSLIFSSLACRGYQILAVSKITKDISYRVPHLGITSLGNFVIVGVQIILLVVWTAMDPFKSEQANVDELRRSAEVICRSQEPTLWWGLEVAYAIILLLFCLAVAYLTWDLKHMVRESKWMSISIYNAVVVLGISISLHSGGINSDDSVFWSTGTVLFLLNTSIMLAMFGPKVYHRVRDEEDTDGTTHTDSKENHAAQTKRESVPNRQALSSARTVSFHSMEPTTPRDNQLSPTVDTRKEQNTASHAVFSMVGSIMSRDIGSSEHLNVETEMTNSHSRLDLSPGIDSPTPVGETAETTSHLV